MANNPWKIKKEDFPKGGDLKNKIKFILGYAILAPSTHNSQPWLFKIKENSCKIYFDKELILPQADPKERDLYISIGCMLDNLFIAAHYFGIFKDYHVHLKDNLIVEVFFQDDGTRISDLEYLLDAIVERVNVRGLFEPKELPRDLYLELTALKKDQRLKINLVTEKDKISQIASLTAEGLKMAHSKKEFRKEMSGWMRNSLSKRKDGLLGYSLRMPFVLSFIIPTIVKFLDMSPLLAKLNYESMASAPAVCVIGSEKNDKDIWLKTGRLAQRLMLHLNSKGIRTSIFVASIEMGDLYKKVQKVLGNDLIPQFVFCAGYMKNAQKHSPRHELESKLI